MLREFVAGNGGFDLVRGLRSFFFFGEVVCVVIFCRLLCGRARLDGFGELSLVYLAVVRGSF